MKSTTIELESRSAPAAPHGSTMTLIDHYLREQQELTAVERFAQRHEAAERPLLAARYSTLLPASPPRTGEQYAFDVDLDACSGCKACVTACHVQNGLDADESWRDVGFLHGGSEFEPFQQHVTAACHHCLDPACLSGCPVQAYEKDPATGIVRHLDDQCIGCQYCIFACPYDVPKYNKARGIVRKCDMCSGRLAAGEAPACVQACPNSAIRITVVSRAEVTENCEAGAFLPGAPDPHLTRPATTYRTRRVYPRNVLPADYYSSRPEHAHWPLILMLVLTELSVGAFLVGLLLDHFASDAGMAEVRGIHAAGALAFGVLALAASTLHLGRPLYAYRAVVGLRTSWLSREILAFGLFAGLAAAYAASVWWSESAGAPPRGIETILGVAVVGTGIAGVICSIMIYQCTGRALWNGASTAVRFLLTTLVLGFAVSLWMALTAAAFGLGPTAPEVMSDFGEAQCRGLIAAAGLKLLFEAALFAHLHDRQHTPLKRSALLMKGEFVRATLWRFVSGAAGGLLLPALLLRTAAAPQSSSTVAALFAAGIFVATLAGELLERYLFFTAVAAPRMPGGLRT
jgi:Fe-S-cluster-containing dehydrogenase component/DMSO reductase anchor subunit